MAKFRNFYHALQIHQTLHVAIIEQLKVKDCSEVFNLVYPPEIKCLAQQLCSDFVLVEELGEKVAIPVEHIMFKCFDISTIGLCALTTLVSECEVVKLSCQINMLS